MTTIISSEALPIHVWADQVDEQTLQQAKNLAKLPFLFPHLALMADCHVGYGMPIGGVAPTVDMVIPNAVGVDIGCGVQAVRTSLTELSAGQIKKLMQGIRRDIPLGFKHHKEPWAKPDMARFMKEAAERTPVCFNYGFKQTGSGCSEPDLEEAEDMAVGPLHPDVLPVISKEYDSSRYQLGTLGGGNHFIEIQRGDDQHIWLMIHSGSRNLGHKVANHYNRLAIEYNSQSANPLPTGWQLDPLPINSPEGQAYLREMSYCVAFAIANRSAMMTRLQQLIEQTAAEVEFDPALDIAHNYAATECHYGRELLVHRKGATRAFAGERGIIPGSQGSRSFIVSGQGSPESFASCSHGAGRKLGRKQAQRSLDLAHEIRQLDQLKVIHAVRGKKDLDEAPGAYKDIEEVMNNQRDLVEIVTALTPLAVIKG